MKSLSLVAFKNYMDSSICIRKLRCILPWDKVLNLLVVLNDKNQFAPPDLISPTYSMYTLYFLC